MGFLVVYLLVLSSGMENRTLSQMLAGCTCQYFYSRVGLLTLIYMVSFTALAMLYPLPIIWKLSTVVVQSVVFWCSNISEGAYKCSLYLSPNVLADSHIYSSLHSILPHSNQYMTLHCFVIVSLSFGNIRRSFKVLPPLKCT